MSSTSIDPIKLFSSKFKEFRKCYLILGYTFIYNSKEETAFLNGNSV